MNGKIVIHVTKSGESDEEIYQFAIQRPRGTTLEQVATVLSIVTRNLRRQAEQDPAARLAADLRQLRDTTPRMPDGDL